MEKDERLLPLPNANDLQLTHQDVAANYSPFYDEDNFSEGRSVREYFLVVYKRLPLILALTIMTTAVTAFYMYRQPSVYQAQTTLIIEPRKPKPTQKNDININFGGDMNYYNTQLRLLQNPDLMHDVVVRLGLQRYPNLLDGQNKGFISSLRSILSGDKSAQNKESTLPVITENSDNSTTEVSLTAEEKAIVENYSGYLLAGLNVEQTKDTNIFNVKVQSTNPELAAKVADTVAQVFIEQNIKREMQGAETTYQDLTKSIDELKGTIISQEQERINYMKSTGMPLATEGEKLSASRLQALSSSWLSAEDNRRKIQAQYEAAVRASQNGDLATVVPDNKGIEQARTRNLNRKADLEKRLEGIEEKIQEAEAKRSQLLVRYTEEYAEVKAINAQIKKLNEDRNRIQSEVSKRIETEGSESEKKAERGALGGLLAQLQAAQRHEAQARASYLNEVGSANQQGQAQTRLTTLTREIETNRNLLDTYTQRQKEMELAISSSRPENISVSSKAQIPGGPVGPQRNRNILIAFLISLVAGIGLAFLFDYLDDSIKTSDDIGRYLGLPTLALIPHQNTVKKAKRNTLAAKNGNGNGLSSTALISLEDNRSAMSEAYRHLRTSLLFSSAGKPPQTILVTSSQPSEGKTTTAINTAITLAQSGADVVIIDCDLRRPRLHSHFDLENTTGLTNYISGEKNPENLLKSYPGLPNLKIITSGPIPPNPAELLSSNEMKNLLQYLKGNFKHVIIDSPPAISFTDAAILSTLVDGVVLVAMAGKSSIHLMRRFKQRLSTIGARIYGVVLNGIKSNSLEYGYYGYGYTYSYYDTPNDDETTPKMKEEITVQTTKN